MAMPKGKKIIGTPFADTLTGSDYKDTLSAGNGDDLLIGGANNDILSGDTGNDTLNGGLGADKMTGGLGDDRYIVDDLKDTIIETTAKNAGNDTIETSLLNYTLPKNVENLYFTGSQAIKGIGNALNNKISGTMGDDTFNGGLGNDTLIGGEGNDTAQFNHPQNQYQITEKISENGSTQFIVSYIGSLKKPNFNDGVDTLSDIEFLKFSDVTRDIRPSNSNSNSNSNQNPSPSPSPVVESTDHKESLPQFIYQTPDVTQLDSVTALLTYSPVPQNNINYSTAEIEKWRIRSSSPALADDLTQTNQVVNIVNIQGNLESNPNAQRWYKLHLTQTTTLNIANLTANPSAEFIDAALFIDNNGPQGLAYFGNFFASTSPVKTYKAIPAGDYFLRIDKNALSSSQASSNFSFVINTQPTQDFLLPPLEFNASTSHIHAELSPRQKEMFYKFTLDTASTFSLNTTHFNSSFEIDNYHFLPNGHLGSQSYRYSQAQPSIHTYNLSAGTYYLHVNAILPLTATHVIDIPVIAANGVMFNINAISNAPNVIQADIANAQTPFTRDAEGNVGLTYSFDIQQVQDDVSLNPFNEVQKAAAKLALQAYANIARLTFVEIPFNSTQKANIVFGESTQLDSAVGDTQPSISPMNDIENVLIRIDFSRQQAVNVDSGSNAYLTLLHEIGHALGLKHPRSYGTGGQDSQTPFLLAAKDNNQYTLMSYNINPYQAEDGTHFYQNSGAVFAKTPLLYDVAAIQFLYGENTQYNAENTVYRWAVNTDPFMTIWDSGGVDTIDVSNQVKPQIIDLRAGEFSSLGAVALAYSNAPTAFFAAKNNVSIAYGTLIENAIGAIGNDTLIGNSVANQLTGGAGQDNFVFAAQLSASNIDTITDFQASEDIFTLNRAIFKNLNSGDKLNTAAFLMSHHAQVAENSLQRIIFNTANHTLFYDSDGLGGLPSVEFAVVANTVQLNADVFFLQG